MQLKLTELENELRVLDPAFEQKTMVQIEDPYNLYNSRQLDHIVLRHALVKPSECLFKPYLIGTEQMGLSEVALQVVSQFSREEQKILLNNVVVTGGGSKIK